MVATGTFSGSTAGGTALSGPALPVTNTTHLGDIDSGETALPLFTTPVGVVTPIPPIVTTGSTKLVKTVVSTLFAVVLCHIEVNIRSH